MKLFLTLFIVKVLIATAACKCPDKWIPFGKSCYFFSEQRWSAGEAQSLCQQRGGNLTSVSTAGEKQWLRNRVRERRKDFWIGLKAFRPKDRPRKVKTDWIWVDGTRFNQNQTVWDGRQPDDSRGKEDCVHWKPNGKWNDNTCRPDHSYICKRDTSIDDMCDLEAGWHPFGNTCYRYFEEIPLNWKNAEKICEQNKGNLMKVDTPAKYNIMKDTVICRDSRSAPWIGLSDTDSPGTFEWIDGTPLGQGHWDKDEPKFSAFGDNCVEAVSSIDFRWRSISCQENERKFICEKPPGSCPRGWRLWRGYCYQYNTDPKKSPQTWVVAEQMCKAQGAQLMKIENQYEQQHMVSILKEIGKGGVADTWIAIADKRSDNMFFWSDGSTINYAKWGKNQPKKSNGRLDCGMVRTSDPNGRWETSYCFNKKTYLCRIPVYQKPGKIKEPIHPFICDKKNGWQLYNKMCYKAVNDAKTWDNSRNKCAQEGAILMTVQDEFEQSFISGMIQRKSWFGLKYDKGKKYYVWSDGKRLGGKTNWGDGSPNVGKNKYCVFLEGRGSQTAVWKSEVCNKKLQSVCKKQADNILVPPPKPTPTPSWSEDCGWDWKWDPIENMCYQIKPSEVIPWVDAVKRCRKRGGDLASIHGPHEQAFLTALIHSAYAGGAPTFWIGANTRDTSRGWLWSDKTPFNYFNWAPGEPNSNGGKEQCVEMASGNEGRWNDASCAARFPFICSKKSKSHTTVAPPTTPAPKTCTKSEPLISGEHNVQDELLTAWSADPQHPPKNARLNSVGILNGHGCWIAGLPEVNQFIQTDFLSPVLVKGIETQGCRDEDVWTMKFKISYQYDQHTYWKIYEDPIGKDKIFNGNKDRNGIVGQTLKYPFNARNVRVWPIEWNNRPQTKMGLRFELIGCRWGGSCRTERLVSGDHWVSDVQLKSSPAISQYYDARYSRIDDKLSKGWVASTSDSNQYIQVDFGLKLRIRKIILQGRKDQPQWVKSYIMQYSVDSVQPLRPYTSPFGTEKVFQGSADQLPKAIVTLKAPLLAQVIRIIPRSWNGAVAMRFEIEGCQEGCGPIPVITGDQYAIGNGQLRASSKYSRFSGPPRSRLNTKRKGPWRGAWSARSKSLGKEWIQADMLTFFSVRAIATRGRQDANEWITEYSIYTSVNGRDWSPVMVNNTIKRFDGNWNNDKVRKQYLPVPVKVRFVRLVPTNFWHFISLRWEIYGCRDLYSSKMMGCFADSKTRRDLPRLELYNPPGGMTQELCIKICFGKDMMYAGLQHGDKCFCGNRYGRYGPATDCKKYLCPGDRRYHCGGELSNLVYSTGLSAANMRCRQGWQPYADRCFRVFPDKQSWKDAQTLCRAINGDLATIKNKDEQNFLFAYIGAFKKENSWIGLSGTRQTGLFEWSDGSMVTYTNWNKGEPNRYQSNEDCVEMYVKRSGRWNDDPCDKAKQYVCQKPAEIFPPGPPPPEPKGCPQGWIDFRWSCYTFVGLFKNWQSALGECRRQGAILVRVHDRVEQAYLSALLGRPAFKGEYWTDLSKDKYGRFIWSNGRDHLPFTNWGTGQPGPNNGSCVSMGTGAQAGLWFTRPCKSSQEYICEKGRVGFTPPPTTPLPPIIGTCSDGWLGVGEYCFQAFDLAPKPNWPSARAECQKRGGDLASFSGPEEYDYVYKDLIAGKRQPYWIGLNRPDGKGYVWSDGSPVEWTNWDKNQPLPIAECVQAIARTGKWRSMLCRIGRSYVCKVKRGKMVTVPVTTAPPTAGPAGSCQPDGDEWKKFGDYCYYVSTADSKGSKTWRQARSYCNSKGGELVSFHSYQENSFVWGQMKDGKRRELWIGLNELDQTKGWSWSDGSPTDFVNWGPGEPNDHDGEESCVILRRTEGKWLDRACGLRFGFVCRKKPGDTGFTLPPPTPMMGNCPVGFEAFGDKCFQLNGVRGNRTSKKNFTDALAACKAYGNDYTLASISNARENAFLTSRLYNRFTAMWLGMFRYETHGKFLWLDNSDVTYTNWAVGFPSGKKWKECVWLLGGLARAGEWKDGPCTVRKGWVCMTYKKPNLPMPPPTPNPCQPGWVPHGPGCYFVSKFVMTWDSAQQDCVTKGANLVSVLNLYEQAFVFTQMNLEQSTDPMWIGLNDQQIPKQYRWSDNFPVTFVNWADGQPKPLNGQQSCVQMKRDGYWENMPCPAEQRKYMCKKTTEKPPFTPAPGTGSCPPDDPQEDDFWIPFLNHCYLFKRDIPRHTHADAYHECDRRGANLVSIHSKEENSFIKMYSFTTLGKWSWIGLNKVGVSGFQWQDGTPYDYQNWGPNEPSDSNRTDGIDCIEYNKKTGFWDDANCALQLNYVCKKPQVYTSGTTVKSMVQVKLQDLVNTNDTVLHPKVETASHVNTSPKSSQSYPTSAPQERTDSTAPTTVSKLSSKHTEIITDNHQTEIRKSIPTIQTATSQNRNENLFQDGKIVIGVCVGIGVTILIVVVLFFIKRTLFDKRNNGFSYKSFRNTGMHDEKRRY